MFCQKFFKEVKIKKMSVKLKIAKFFIICKIYLLTPIYQGLVFYQFYYIYIKFLFMRLTFYFNFNNFKIVYKKN